MTEWQTKTVGELADTQLGKMLNKGKQTGEHTTPYLRSVNVQWGRVDTSDLNQMDIFPNELEKFTIKKGDLLICEGGESGRVAIWDRDEPIGFQNALHRVRAKAEVTNKYLYYYFEWLVKNQLIEHLFNGVTIKHFPQENLRSVEVSYPPIDEQQKIVELLEDHLSRLDAALADVKAAKIKAAQFRRSLLRAAFSGNLIGNESHHTTDWKIEKLSALLEVSIGGIWGEEAGTSEVNVSVVRVTELKAHGRIDPSTAVTRSVTQKQLSKTLTNNQNTYNALNQLNIEIEREIAGLNMNLNAKNDKVVNNIGRMQLADMAKQYYTLKNAYPLVVE
jgi:hypothetical protein